MLIDTHVHVFPDKIAEKAIPVLAASAHIAPSTNGTISDTLKKMDKWGVDKIWGLGIATNAKQVHNVNTFVASVRSDRIEPLGSLYPYSDNVMQDVQEVIDLGFNGIKLHPEYAAFNPADEILFPVYDRLEKEGLLIVFHAGHDVAFPNTYYAAPKNIAVVAKNFPKLKIVAAHLGGYESGDEIIENYKGLDNMYIDTALMSAAHPMDMIKKIFNFFDKKKILFATDCPWSKPEVELNVLNQLGLTNDDKELVLYKNAEKLIKR